MCLAVLCQCRTACPRAFYGLQSCYSAVSVPTPSMRALLADVSACRVSALAFIQIPKLVCVETTALQGGSHSEPVRYAVSTVCMQVWPRTLANYQQCLRRGPSTSLTVVILVQATGLLPRNGASQYEPIVMDAAQLAALREAPQYSEFLAHVRGATEAALLQNNVIDVFADDFCRLREEEAIKGNRSGKPINATMSFMDIAHCKHKMVSALHWHPTQQARPRPALRVPICQGFDLVLVLNTHTGQILAGPNSLAGAILIVTLSSARGL